MPDNSDQEKSFQPTPERMRQARQHGDVVVSQEVVTVMMLLGTLLYLSFARGMIGRAMSDCLRDYLAFTRRMDLDITAFGRVMLGMVGHAMHIIAPLLGVVVVLALGSVVAQVGLRVAEKKSLFDPKRMDPAAGVKKLFSMQRWFEGLKSLLKAVLFGWICYDSIHDRFGRIMILGAMDLDQSLETMVGVAMTVVYRAGLLMIVFAAVDFAFQKWRHHKKLMMSHQELKDEMKHLEGDPRAKQRQRAKQMEMTRNRMMNAVGKADVVITNPTHYAVAIQYDPAISGAPRLVAKGARLLAQRIKDEARRHNVPVVEDKFVARAIYFGCKLGQEIPYSLYRAVAEILAYVYKIAGKMPKRRENV